jgi:hypothetical protein
MIHRFTPRTVAAALTTLALLAVIAGPASAKSTTLRLYAKTVSDKAYLPSGAPVKPDTIPTVGDVNVTKENIYAGSRAAHAAKPEGTVRITCTLKRFVSLSDVEAACTGVLTIGRSSLTTQETLDVAKLPKTYTSAIVRGAGGYRGATGRWTTTNLSATQNDLVVTVKT